MENKIVEVYFWASRRNTKEFDENYKPKIDEVVNKGNCRFVVGDYDGVDVMAQNYLVEKGCADIITVFHMFISTRK